MFKKNKRQVWPFTLPGVKPKRSNKKRILAGLGGAVVAIIAGGFVKDKQDYRP